MHGSFHFINAKQGGLALISCINFASKSNCNQSIHFKGLVLLIGFIRGLITRYNLGVEEVSKREGGTK